MRVDGARAVRHNIVLGHLGEQRGVVAACGACAEREQVSTGGSGVSVACMHRSQLNSTVRWQRPQCRQQPGHAPLPMSLRPAVVQASARSPPSPTARSMASCAISRYVVHLPPVFGCQCSEGASAVRCSGEQGGAQARPDAPLGSSSSTRSGFTGTPLTSHCDHAVGIHGHDVVARRAGRVCVGGHSDGAGRRMHTLAVVARHALPALRASCRRAE